MNPPPNVFKWISDLRRALKKAEKLLDKLPAEIDEAAYKSVDAHPADIPFWTREYESLCERFNTLPLEIIRLETAIADAIEFQKKGAAA